MKTESRKNPLVFSLLEWRSLSLSILSTLLACLDIHTLAKWFRFAHFLHSFPIESTALYHVDHCNACILLLDFHAVSLILLTLLMFENGNCACISLDCLLVSSAALQIEITLYSVTYGHVIVFLQLSCLWF